MKIKNTIQRAIFCVAITLASIFCVEFASAQVQTTKAPPKGAKYKTIEYIIADRSTYSFYDKKLLSYAISGYVHKKKFVENQNLKISTPTSSIVGVYYIDDNGDASIDGTETIYTDENKSQIESIIEGDFIISNSHNKNELVLKYINIKSAFADFKDTKEYATHIVSSIKDYTKISEWLEKSFYASIHIDDVDKERHFVPGVSASDPFLRSGSMERAKVFRTIITITKSTGDAIATINIEGSCKFSSQKYLSLSMLDYGRCAQVYGDYPQAKIILENGDVFDGSAHVNGNNEIEIESGTYRVNSGEVLDGNISRSYLYDNFIFGEQTTFTDGTSEKGNWLEKYDMSEEDWGSISSEASNLTKQHKMVVDLHQQRVEQARLKEMERIKIEQRRKDDEEKGIQRAALRKQILINKYGDYYAELISKGQFELGMTKAMVTEVWNKQCFSVSSQYLNGQIIEIWIFSKDRMQAYLITEAHKEGNANAGVAAAMTISLAEAFGVRLPRRFVFTDNILTEIFR